MMQGWAEDWMSYHQGRDQLGAGGRALNSFLHHLVRGSVLGMAEKSALGAQPASLKGWHPRASVPRSVPAVFEAPVGTLTELLDESGGRSPHLQDLSFLSETRGWGLRSGRDRPRPKRVGAAGVAQ